MSSLIQYRFAIEEDKVGHIRSRGGSADQILGKILDDAGIKLHRVQKYNCTYFIKDYNTKKGK